MAGIGKTIAIIQGHPDSGGGHFCHALAEAYRDGAESAGHRVETIVPARMQIPFLRSKAEWEEQDPPDFVSAAQDAIWRADHIVIVFPLWLGAMPALLKAFLEHVLRPGFAFDIGAPGKLGKKRLRGRSARIIVTMGMPSLFYRWFYFSHSLKSLQRNILAFCGFAPIRASVIGMVEASGSGRRERWLAKVRILGQKVL